MPKLFVYGTLKQGHGNHKYFLSKAKLLGKFITPPKYTMYSLGGFPGVIDAGETSIHGEVYEVTDEEFARIDRLEGYPSMYTRKQIDTDYGKAWIYIWNYDTKGLEKVETGNW